MNHLITSLLFILLFLSICLFGQNKSITGVWEVTASSWTSDTKEFADCKMVKFITPSRWASIFYRPDNGEVAGSVGGTYTYDGLNYVETIEYFTFDSSAVGTQQYFTLKLNDDGLMVQEGNIQTERFDMTYHAYYKKVDNLHDQRADQNFITGTWEMEKATWGENTRDEAFLTSRYGRIIKLITPKYFYVAYFDTNKKAVGGVVFGTMSIDQDSFDEQLLSWSWDPTSIGSKAVYNWSVDNQGKLRQFGKLAESDQYKDYRIDEYYSRIEPVESYEKLWTEEDRNYLLQNLDRTTSELDKEVAGLTEEQWHFQEAQGKWSIAQVIEHLGIYERKYYDQRYQTSLLPPEPELAQSTPPDAFYLEWLYEENAHEAPLSATPLELMVGDKNWTYFKVGRDRNVEKIQSADVDFRAFYSYRSRGRRWNIHQLYIILFAHCDRHLRQIKRIKSHPDFPKSIE